MNPSHITVQQGFNIVDSQIKVTITDIALMTLVKFTDTSKIERSIDLVNRMFLAPEVKENEFDDRTVTPKADIWSLGVIMFLLINRKLKIVQDENPVLQRK